MEGAIGIPVNDHEVIVASAELRLEPAAAAPIPRPVSRRNRHPRPTDAGPPWPMSRGGCPCQRRVPHQPPPLGASDRRALEPRSKHAPVEILRSELSDSSGSPGPAPHPARLERADSTDTPPGHTSTEDPIVNAAPVRGRRPRGARSSDRTGSGAHPGRRERRRRVWEKPGTRCTSRSDRAARTARARQPVSTMPMKK